MKNAKFKTLMTLALVALTLTGCATALLGGGALGVMSVTDRRSTGAQTDDQMMELRIQNQAGSHLRERNSIQGFDPVVSVVSYNRHVLLLGMVATEADKAFVERVARAEPNATQVYNHIHVTNAQRGFGDISSDSWITSKVRTTLLGATGVPSNQVKVITFNGITYVMGVLTPAEQAAVSHTVSTTAGVRQVVTLYETFIPVQ